MSIFVNLFLCLEFYSKISIDRSGYFVYNSNRPTGRLLDSGFGLIDKFADYMSSLESVASYCNVTVLLDPVIYNDKLFTIMSCFSK